MRSVIIIGGGLSGALVALNLIRLNPGLPMKISLVDSNRRIGRGLAYSTARVCHRLNVRARHLGAFPDDPGDFVRWLRGRQDDVGPDGFAAREQYGRYIEELLQRYFDNSGAVTVDILHDEAIDASAGEYGAIVTLQSGQVLAADTVVLAFGNFPPAHLPMLGQDVLGHLGYIADPWVPGAVDRLAESQSLLLIGTGLTMVDVALSLREHGYAGKVFALSTHGRLPAVQESAREYPDFYEELKGETRVASMVRIVRKQVQAARLAGIGWQAVIDSLRPHIQKLWLALPFAERTRFQRHVRHFWDGARHRMAPECGEGIDAMQQSGQLSVTAGRIEKVRTQGDTLVVQFHRRGQSHTETIEVEGIVNCTGPATDYRTIDRPLVTNLLRRGILRRDQLLLGADALPDGRLLDATGLPSNIFYTLGPPLKGVLWESTAVREIRDQAAELAARLLASTETGHECRHSPVPSQQD